MKQSSLMLYCMAILLQSCLAQTETKVDSVLSLVRKSRSTGGVDTAAFRKAMGAMNEIEKNSNMQAVLEREASAFRDMGALDQYYSIKTTILKVLCDRPETDKAIEYGKPLIQELEACRSAVQKRCLLVSIHAMRLPFRNSDRIGEGFRYIVMKLSNFQVRKDSEGMSICYFVLGGFYRTTGLKEQGLYNTEKAMSYLSTSRGVSYGISNEEDDMFGIGGIVNCTTVIGQCALEGGDYARALKYFIRADSLCKMMQGPDIATPIPNASYIAFNIANAKLRLGQLDSVAYWLGYAERISLQGKVYANIAFIRQIQSLYYAKSGQLDSAEWAVKEEFQLIERYKIPANSGSGILIPRYHLALIRVGQRRFLEAIDLLKEELPLLHALRNETLQDRLLLADIYTRMGRFQEAGEEYRLSNSIRSVIASDEKKNRTMSYEIEKKISESEQSIRFLEGEKETAARERIFIIGVAVMVSLFALAVYTLYRNKVKTSMALQLKSEQLEASMQRLRAAQQQLIHTEKMASLGQLTAGIAHEIKNPLNFVNNFSEISIELVDELILAKTKTESEMIAQDLKTNLSKINHHGKRADGIVKSMMMHARSEGGERQPTDINYLLEEAMNLTYHGFRALIPHFTIAMEKEYDETLPKIYIQPQDINRVFLNILNNAMYAANTAAVFRTPPPNEVGDKEGVREGIPSVRVSTKNLGGKIEIRIRDNGNGIPENIRGKIFEPFFTTKPTGQGTGLGLSISYEIIKAHGGDIQVESVAGIFTEFQIMLPHS